MRRPFWVIEDIDIRTSRHLFDLWSIRWLATRNTWASVVFSALIGLGVAALLGQLTADPSSWLTGLGYGLLFYSTNILHSIGHMLSGHMVAHPMQANLLTATWDVNHYEGDQSMFPRRVHVGRALGGPLLNFAIALLSLALWRWLGWTWLMVAAVMHFGSGIFTLLPIAPMDGWVLWQHLRGRAPAGE
jgi:hypothetical protein